MLSEGTAEALVKVLDDLSEQLREARRHRGQMFDLLVEIARCTSANNDLLCEMKEAFKHDAGKEAR